MPKVKIQPLIHETILPTKNKKTKEEEKDYYAKITVTSPNNEIWEEHICYTFAELYLILHLIANNLVNLALQDVNREGK